MAQTRLLTPYVRLQAELQPIRDELVRHPVYKRLTDPQCLRTFMACHVFAVWDFMSLLKTLQRRLTSIAVPWLPPADTVAARLVNEIVLGEETDEVAPGKYVSHFELYLQAMDEVGADAGPVCAFVERLQSGASVAAALEEAQAPAPAHNFVLDTFRSCDGPNSDVAAAFLLGREDLVPAMFRPMIAELERSGVKCETYRLYLERHVHLDEEEHGPMARRLLESLCGNDRERWQATERVARTALAARRRLWDGVLALMDEGRGEWRATASAPGGH